MLTLHAMKSRVRFFIAACLRKTKVVFLLAWAAAGCDSSPSLPPDVLGYDSMALIMRDVHLLEVHLQQRSWFGDSAAVHGIPLYRALFRQHGVSAARFRRSWGYYRSYPAAMESVYVRVVPLLREAVPRRDSADAHP